MDYGIFFTGFGLGILFTAIPFYLAYRHIKNIKGSTEEQLKMLFENTANKIFQTNTTAFSTQAGERLDEYFKRFKDKLEDFEKINEEKFRFEAESFTKFDLNIKTFIAAGSQISRDTAALANIMKSDNRAQGHWGEIVLEKVLESSGLRKNEDYKLQEGSSQGRPDATIYLPENRCVFIDAKTSISSWDRYVNAENEEEKNIALKEFISSTKAHISGLAKRNYSSEEKSPDYVLMFIPIEGCYSLMFCENCDLWKLAWDNKIMPVSPSTLLAALKIINAFHVIDKQNKNAVEISKLSTAMINKFSALLTDLLKSRNLIDASLKKLQGKGNIITQIEKIQDLGVVIEKPLPEIPEELTTAE